MSIAVIGGMDRLKRDYQKVGVKYGVDIYHFERGRQGLQKRLGRMDAMVIFTGRISHNAMKQARSVATAGGARVIMSRACGLSSLGRCLDRIIKEEN
jgi:hypothetical protein